MSGPAAEESRRGIFASPAGDPVRHDRNTGENARRSGRERLRRVDPFDFSDSLRMRPRTRPSVTVATWAIAAREVAAWRSYRVATRRQVLSRQKSRSRTLRRRQARGSRGSGVLREAVEGMTALLRRSSSRRRRRSASWALSAISRREGAATSSRGMAREMSATLPGVGAKTTGRPRSSARRWIFEVRPPRLRPMASCRSPFSSPPPSDAPSHGCCRSRVWPGPARTPRSSRRAGARRPSSANGDDGH